MDAGQLFRAAMAEQIEMFHPVTVPPQVLVSGAARPAVREAADEPNKQFPELASTAVRTPRFSSNLVAGRGIPFHATRTALLHVQSDVKDQGTTMACTAFAVTTGMAMRYAIQTSQPSLRDGTRPSAAHAYCLQRQEECRTTRRCSCGPKCNDACDANCGSLLDVMLQSCKLGLVSEEVWPFAKSQDQDLSRRALELTRDAAHQRYRLTHFEWLTCEPSVLATYLEDGYPVVITMRLYKNQWRFFVECMRASSLESATFPAPSGVMEKMGHSVVVYGVTPHGFLVRNSFGREWGFNGDFLLSFRHVNASQLFAAVAILEVRSQDT